VPAVLAVVVVSAAAAAFVIAGCDMPSTGGLGQVGGSGVIVTQHYDFTGFTKVVVDSGFDVEIDYADTCDVTVRVDDNLVQEHLKVELDGDTLHVGLAPLWNYHDVITKARITLPRLSGLEASGSSAILVTKLKSGAPLELEASGSSTVELVGVSFGDVAVDVSGASRVLGDMTSGELTGELSGGSAVEFGGTASSLRLDASGGSRLDLLELRAVDADLALSGGSNGQVTVTGSLTVEASGGSRLEYAGDPQVTLDASGGSAVEPY
jgi:serine/threonine-protein kinase